MVEFSYITGNEELLEEVRDLWCKLNKYHGDNSRYFSDRFKTYKFEDRKEALIEKAKKGKIRIDLVKDEKTNKKIGYCISTIDHKNIGEIDSIYLEKEFRGFAVGDKLMENASDWLQSNGVNSIKIGVSVGNEDVISFYSRYGFYPLITVLQKK